MNIFINGKAYTLPASTNQEHSHTVEAALKLFLTEQQTQTSFAVALNGDFVSKPSYSSTPINADDALDVLFPIVGG